MKTCKILITGSLLLASTLCLSCGQKVISSDRWPTQITTEERKAGAPQPEGKAEEKPRGTPGEPSIAAVEKEKKFGEEQIREKDLGEKAAREKELKEATARKEALARAEALKDFKLESVFYDFDQWGLREDQKESMNQNARWLQGNPTAKILIEGNCDERGTAEYNLALGQKRADAAKAFLEGLGISGNRMQTISYGFERPLDRGHTEEAWAKNRRVDFVPLK